jgi:formylglycine-generating enzyme required for sulfatase activity
MGTNPSHFKGDARPVESVSWNDVQKFLARLNARNDGHHYRLPTEAEWEYAARAGTTGALPGVADAIAWYDGNASRITHSVGGKECNLWGFCDMIGNVEEWVNDVWAGYGRDFKVDPQGPTKASIVNRLFGGAQVLRGGWWLSSLKTLRVSARHSRQPGGRKTYAGFRVARDETP